MSDHVVVVVDGLVSPPVEAAEAGGKGVPPGGPASSVVNKEVDDDMGEEEPLIQVVECRICQEEDQIGKLETPCACSGSLKYAHRLCVQRWCDEKGDTTCEICHQPYQPGYTAPPVPRIEDTTIDIRAWTLNGTPLAMNDPHLLAMAEAQRHFVEADYDEYAASNASGAAFCRSTALILMALLLFRHALSMTDDGNGDGDDDASTFFSLFLLRAAGFLLPCYIMAWAISILQRRRQRLEAAELAASRFAFVIQSSHRGVHFAVAPGHPGPPPEEAV